MSSFTNSPAWSIAKRSKNGQIKGNRANSPGPGNYNTTIDIANKKHGWKMGTSNRNKDDFNYVPGPGKYDFLSKNSGPKISIGTKPTSYSKDQNVPGPGNYNLNDNAVTKVNTGYTMASKYISNK